jgi:rSAM/selenodomain-associated transferase 1
MPASSGSDMDQRRANPQARPVVVVLARAPEVGRVKTRLMPRLGAERAADLHVRMVHHTLATLALARVGPVELWCAADGNLSLLEACRRKLGVPLHMQPEGDLGQRMSAIAAQALSRASGVVMVGTDVPSMTAGDVIEARQALAEGNDAVVGPAEDGGYYLLGLNRHAPEVFDGIDWGTPAVLMQTRVRMLALHWRTHELQLRWDVDTPADYDRLRADRQLAYLTESLEAAGFPQ